MNNDHLQAHTAGSARLLCAIMVCVLLFVTACAPRRGIDTPDWNHPDWAKVVMLEAEVCVPDATVVFEEVLVDTSRQAIEPPHAHYQQKRFGGAEVNAAAKEVAPCDFGDQGESYAARRWLKSAAGSTINSAGIPSGDVTVENGVASAGRGSINLIGSTEAGQPVYNVVERPHGSHIGIYVLKPGHGTPPRDEPRFWFEPPKVLPHGAFSAWLPPKAVELQRTSSPLYYRLVHGAKLEPTPIQPDAPRIRFRVLTQADLYDKQRCWRRAKKVIAEQHYRPLVGKPERANVHFVPGRDRPIPKC